MKDAGSPAPSPDRRWMLYTVSTPDWKEAKTQQDVYLVSLQQGVPSTQADDVHKGEERNVPALGEGRPVLRVPVEPRCTGKRRVPQPALPDAPRRRRSAPDHRREGGRRPTSRSARTASRSCTAAARAARNSCIGLRGRRRSTRAAAEQLTKHPTGVSAGWKWAPTAGTIYFTSPDTADADEKARREKKFTVNIRNMETPAGEPVGARCRRQDDEAADRTAAYQPARFTISDDGKWIGVPRRLDEPLQAQHHGVEPVRRPVPARHRRRPDRAADEEPRGRREDR